MSRKKREYKVEDIGEGRSRIRINTKELKLDFKFETERAKEFEKKVDEIILSKGINYETHYIKPKK